MLVRAQTCGLLPSVGLSGKYLFEPSKRLTILGKLYKGRDLLSLITEGARWSFPKPFRLCFSQASHSHAMISTMLGTGANSVVIVSLRLKDWPWARPLSALWGHTFRKILFRGRRQELATSLFIPGISKLPRVISLSRSQAGNTRKPYLRRCWRIKTDCGSCKQAGLKSFR